MITHQNDRPTRFTKSNLNPTTLQTNQGFGRLRDNDDNPLNNPMSALLIKPKGKRVKYCGEYSHLRNQDQSRKIGKEKIIYNHRPDEWLDKEGQLNYTNDIRNIFKNNFEKQATPEAIGLIKRLNKQVTKDGNRKYMPEQVLEVMTHACNRIEYVINDMHIRKAMRKLGMEILFVPRGQRGTIKNKQRENKWCLFMKYYGELHDIPLHAVMKKAHNDGLRQEYEEFQKQI